MDEKISYDILDTISVLFTIMSLFLGLSIFITDLFWFLPGVFIFLIASLCTTMSFIYSRRILNGICLIIIIISLIIFASPLLLG